MVKRSKPSPISKKRLSAEIPGANGQGETIEETKESLRQAIELIIEDRRADVRY